MSSNPYEGSQSNPNITGATVDFVLRRSMAENGWRFKDRSNPSKTYWQFTKPLENGRYDEITCEEHEKESVHIKMKMMMKKEEKPTKEQFINLIAPQLKNGVKRALTVKLCSRCGSEIPSNSEPCPNCGNEASE